MNNDYDIYVTESVILKICRRFYLLLFIIYVAQVFIAIVTAYNTKLTGLVINAISQQNSFYELFFTIILCNLSYLAFFACHKFAWCAFITRLNVFIINDVISNPLCQNMLSSIVIQRLIQNTSVIFSFYTIMSYNITTIILNMFLAYFISGYLFYALAFGIIIWTCISFISFVVSASHAKKFTQRNLTIFNHISAADSNEAILGYANLAAKEHYTMEAIFSIGQTLQLLTGVMIYIGLLLLSCYLFYCNQINFGDIAHAAIVINLVNAALFNIMNGIYLYMDNMMSYIECVNIWYKSSNNKENTNE